MDRRGKESGRDTFPQSRQLLRLYRLSSKPPPHPPTPPPLDAASSTRSPSHSPPASCYTALPVALDDIPERFHRFFHEDIIPAEFYPLVPHRFPYGAPAANAVHVYCPRGTTRQVPFSVSSPMGANEGQYTNMSFFGTVIIRVMPRI